MFSFFKTAKTTPVAAKKPKSKTVKATSQAMQQLLAPKLPEGALAYCVELWAASPFSFSITKSRNSCLGNYQFKDGQHKITVNSDLNQYSFLITYIHEVAHQHVCIAHPPKPRKKVLPHGSEWQSTFMKLMTPMLNEAIFPQDILQVLCKHMLKPAASSTSDPTLVSALRRYDLKREGMAMTVTLQDVGANGHFDFKGRIFKKLENRRTRALCLEVKTNRKYTIPLRAEVIAS